MTTPVIRLSALLACFALSAFAIPSACDAGDRDLTPVERTPAAAKPLGQLVSNTAQRHTVAKPAYPVWEDAARLNDERRAGSSTAKRRTAYQNPPDPLNLRGLSNGFRAGTRPLAEAGQRAGEWIDSQARGVAEGTRQLVDQTGENVRNGARDALNGTASTLQRALPGSTGPYAERTQFDDDGYNPSPTRADDSQFASPDTNYRDAQLRDAQLRADQQRREEQERARRQREADSLAADRAYEQRLDREAAARRRGVSTDSLVERFADDSDRFAETRAPLAPVRRTQTSRVANDQDAWRPFDSDSTAGDYPPRTSREYGTDSTGFPALNPPRTDWNAGLTRGQSPNPTRGSGQQPYAPPYNPGVAAQPAQGGPAPANSGNTGSTNWGDRVADQQSAAANTAGGFVGTNTTGDAMVREDSTNLDRLLLVILGAASCFTWLAYYDVRQKYRLALRGVQVSDFGSQSAAA